jgi:hypothetical protein
LAALIGMAWSWSDAMNVADEGSLVAGSPIATSSASAGPPCCGEPAPPSADTRLDGGRRHRRAMTRSCARRGVSGHGPPVPGVAPALHQNRGDGAVPPPRMGRRFLQALIRGLLCASGAGPIPTEQRAVWASDRSLGAPAGVENMPGCIVDLGGAVAGGGCCTNASEPSAASGSL